MCFILLWCMCLQLAAMPLLRVIVQQCLFLNSSVIVQDLRGVEGWGRGLAQEHGYTARFWGAGKATHEGKALAALGLHPPGFASQVHTHHPQSAACHIILLIVEAVKLLQHVWAPHCKYTLYTCTLDALLMMYTV